MPETFQEKAQKVKAEIRELIRGTVSKGAAHGPYQNPIARVVGENFSSLSRSSQEFIGECQKSARLVIAEEHLPILQAYYENRKKQDDALGNLYKSLTFDQFVLRLWGKRYKEVYMDGRVVIPREDTHFRAESSGDGMQGKRLLDLVGTPHDTKALYREYLTLEEMVLSPLVLPQASSIFIGTGSRKDEWKPVQEFNDSVDAATVSYPAAAEFRNGNTVHYDLLFIAQPIAGYSPEQQARLDKIKSNPALLAAAKQIYGEPFAFSPGNKPDDFIQVRGHLLLKSALMQRTKHTLWQVLKNADQQMQKDGLGTVLQMKGLGIGAFGFYHDAADKIQMENMYRQALKEVLDEHGDELQYMTAVNLINLPSQLEKPSAQPIPQPQPTKMLRVKLTESRGLVNPTQNASNIGAVVVCGDSGSKFGNEGNLGTPRSSSDDPAAQYSLLNPTILDPQLNQYLQNAACIHVATKAKGLMSLAAYEPAVVEVSELKAVPLPPAEPQPVKRDALPESTIATPQPVKMAPPQTVEPRQTVSPPPLPHRPIKAAPASPPETRQTVSSAPSQVAESIQTVVHPPVPPQPVRAAPVQVGSSTLASSPPSSPPKTLKEQVQGFFGGVVETVTNFVRPRTNRRPGVRKVEFEPIDVELNALHSPSPPPELRGVSPVSLSDVIVTPRAVVTTASPVVEAHTSSVHPAVASVSSVVTPLSPYVEPVSVKKSEYQIKLDVAHEKLGVVWHAAHINSDVQMQQKLNEALVVAAREFALAHFAALKHDAGYKDEDNIFSEYQKHIQAQAKSSDPATAKIQQAANQILKGFEQAKEEIKTIKEKKLEGKEVRFKLGTTKEKKPYVAIEADDMAPMRDYLQKRFGDGFKVTPPGNDGIEQWQIPAGESLEKVMQDMRVHLETPEGSSMKVIDFPSTKELEQWKTNWYPESFSVSPESHAETVDSLVVSPESPTTTRAELGLPTFREGDTTPPLSGDDPSPLSSPAATVVEPTLPAKTATVAARTNEAPLPIGARSPERHKVSLDASPLGSGSISSDADAPAGIPRSIRHR